MADLIDVVRECLDEFKADEVANFDAEGLKDSFAALVGHEISEIEKILQNINQGGGEISPIVLPTNGKKLWCFARPKLAVC